MRESFRQYERDCTYQSLGNKQPGKQLPHTHGLFCTHVIADDRNTACRHADYDRDNDLEKFHYDPDDRHGDLCVLLL